MENINQLSFLIFTVLIQIASGRTSKTACRFTNFTSLQCTGITIEIFQYYPPLTLNKTVNLELINYNGTVLNLTTIDQTFPNIVNLTMVNGALTSLIGNATKLKVLKLNQLPLRHIKESTLGSLRSLETLDLRNNSFQHLHEGKLSKLSRISNIYLAGNRWDCKLDLNWIYTARNSSNIKDLNTTVCHGEPFDGKPLVFLAELKHNTSETCPRRCSCSISAVTLSPETDFLRSSVTVNCTHRNLTNFPANLPRHTTRLILNNNTINNLTYITKNPIYQFVTDLFLDYNNISSIKVLDGSYWLSNFRILSLKGNQLTDLPTYALTNALKLNPNMPNAVMLYLSGNPWKCNCVFTPRFQDRILTKYSGVVQDLQEIRCGFIKGDQNSLKPIIQLSKAKICHAPPSYSEKALNLLNAILASLIVLVLGKLGYDYYHFKKNGKLPWIVTKIP